MRTKSGKLATLTCAALAVAACGSDDGVASAGTLAASIESAAWRHPSTTPQRSSVAGPSDGSMASDEVRSAFDWLMLARIHCGRQPRECVVDDLAVPGSSVHAALLETFAVRVRHGIVASDRGSHRHRITEAVMLGDDRAEVRVCHSDDVVLVVAGANGRPAAIYDESLVSHWSTWTLQKTHDGWRWTDEVVDERVHGEDRCQ